MASPREKEEEKKETEYQRKLPVGMAACPDAAAAAAVAAGVACLASCLGPSVVACAASSAVDVHLPSEDPCLGAWVVWTSAARPSCEAAVVAEARRDPSVAPFDDHPYSRQVSSADLDASLAAVVVVVAAAAAAAVCCSVVVALSSVAAEL